MTRRLLIKFIISLGLMISSFRAAKLVLDSHRRGSNPVASNEILLSSIGIHQLNISVLGENELGEEEDKLSWPFESPDDVLIFLAHVGKAGGKSIYAALNATKSGKGFAGAIECRIKQQNNTNKTRPLRNTPFKVSQQLMGHFHLHAHGYSEKQLTWLKNHTNLLLHTVRDPVDRFVSAFNYHYWKSFNSGNNPSTRAKMIFKSCFPTVEVLARSASKNNQTFCGKQALPLIQGAHAQPTVHFRYNYGFYRDALSKPNPDRHVAVVRTELMWHDLARLEELLGGDPSYFLSLAARRYVRDSTNYTVNSGVSEWGAFRLCCGLYDEMRQYQELILEVVNLKPSEKAAEVMSVQRHCGITPEEYFLTNASKWIDWERTRCQS